MKSFQLPGATAVRGRLALLRRALAIFVLTPGTFALAAHSHPVLWDTLAPFDPASSAAPKTTWKAVPADLLSLEKDPPKASSDPGYYGREYAFQGDAVVENSRLAAVFLSTPGRVLIYAKRAAPSGDAGSTMNPLGRKVLELVPSRTPGAPASIRRCEIVRNVSDEVVLQVSFAAPGSAEMSTVFAFDRSEIVEVKPLGKGNLFQIESQLARGVAPTFVGDDLIFGPDDFAPGKGCVIPADNFFLGLVQGGDAQWVLTWPPGKQQLILSSTEAPETKGLADRAQFDPDGQSFYLAPLSAPGIWHRVKLTPSFLEKDVPIDWKPPYPAKWKTQLLEEGVKATYAFRGEKGQVWRGVPGSYAYPVWIDGGQVFYRLTKKVPPKGDSIIYAIESADTPPNVVTPVDIVKATLGRPMATDLLDPAGRKLRTHHRRGAEGVRRACTCGCTEFIQAFFEAGEEVQQQEEIREALDDMVYFVQRHLERIAEYQAFASEMLKFVHASHRSTPEAKNYLDGVGQIAQQILQEHEVQKENMKSLNHAQELVRQTRALAAKKDPANLKRYLELLKAWRDMGGAQDYVVAQCHTLTRKLSQVAGYTGAQSPATSALAKEIRQRCRQVLRHADGYEIWANY